MNKPSTAPKPTPEELIESYLAAFRRVNPDAELPVIEFSKGWYHYSFGIFISRRMRGATLATIRDTLIQRAEKL
jgi:hypothetical protein